MIRLDHVHNDGKRCYVMRSRRRLEQAGRFRVGTGEVSAAFMPYTGSWYAWDDDGRWVGQFDRTFFAAHLAPCRVATFEEDPECVPQ